MHWSRFKSWEREEGVDDGEKAQRTGFPCRDVNKLREPAACRELCGQKHLHFAPPASLCLYVRSSPFYIFFVCLFFLQSCNKKSELAITSCNSVHAVPSLDKWKLWRGLKTCTVVLRTGYIYNDEVLLMMIKIQLPNMLYTLRRSNKGNKSCK